jgi:hypothetical protein
MIGRLASKRTVHKKLLALGWPDLMCVPDLQNISGVPIEANGFLEW